MIPLMFGLAQPKIVSEVRKCVWLAALSGLTFVLLVFMGALWSRTLWRIRSEVVSERYYRTSGLPWKTGDLQPSPTVTAQENAAPLIEKCVESSESGRLADILIDVETQVSARNWSATMAQLQSVEPQFKVLVTASQRTRVDFERDWERSTVLFPEHEPLFDLVKLLRYRAIAEYHLGEVNECLADLVTILRIGDLMGQEESLLPMVWKVKCDLRVASALNEIIQTSSSSAQARWITSKVVRHHKHPSLAHAFAGEAFKCIWVVRVDSVFSDNEVKSLDHDGVKLPRRDIPDVPSDVDSSNLLTSTMLVWGDIQHKVIAEQDDPSAIRRDLEVMQRTRAIDAMNRMELLNLIDGAKAAEKDRDAFIALQ